MLYIEITGDTNDADYVSQINQISPEDLELIKPVIEAIKNFEPYQVDVPDPSYPMKWTHCHNFSHGEYIRDDLGEKSAYQYYTEKGITEEQFETFQEFVPRGEHGIHTIESIKLYEVSNVENLL